MLRKTFLVAVPLCVCACVFRSRKHGERTPEIEVRLHSRHFSAHWNPVAPHFFSCQNYDIFLFNRCGKSCKNTKYSHIQNVFPTPESNLSSSVPLLPTRGISERLIHSREQRLMTACKSDFTVISHSSSHIVPTLRG